MLATIFMNVDTAELGLMMVATIVVFGIVGMVGMAVLKVKSKNQPVITLKAKVVDKITPTVFAFEFENGERRNFTVYNTILVVGDEGDLTYQGYFFKSFVKKGK